MTYDRFKEELDLKPFWVKNEKDALRYAAHLKYRLYESNRQIEGIILFLKEHKYGELINPIRDGMLKKCSEVDDLYLAWQKEKQEDKENQIN